MKKIIASIFAASLLLMGTQAYAQWVPGAGYVHAIENSKGIGNTESLDPVHLNGFYVGTSYNIPLVGILGVAPGLYADFLFQEKRWEQGAGSKGIVISGSANAHYTEVALNVPVNLTLHHEINDNAAIFAYAGPMFQLGLMARSTYSGSISIGPIHLTEGDSYDHYNKDNGDTNRFNIFVGGGAGVQFGDLQIMVGYDYGVTDTDRSENYRTNRQHIKAGINFAF